jgi:uncharacterized protein DUF1259
MQTASLTRSIVAGLFTSLLFTACHSSAQAPQRAQSAQASLISWSTVDQALGRSGMTQPDGVRRYSFPRSDLSVQLDGVQIKPALALGSWLAFQPMGSNSVVMGDLVLTEDEVSPVMGGLLNGGIHVTAVHNHLLRAVPQTIYMHVWGQGDPARLAQSLHAALALSHTPLAAPPAPPPPAQIDLDTAAMDRAIGKQGKVNGGVYQFTLPRAEKIMDNGMAEGASMGTGTSINMQPLGGGRAATTGDFVLLASEVDPVMRVLRSGNIEVTALHTHMLGEQPTLYFMHYWGVGQASQLAATLRKAVDLTHVKR